MRVPEIITYSHEEGAIEPDDLLNRQGWSRRLGELLGKTEYWGNSYGYDAWGNLLQKIVTKCSAETLSVATLINNQLSGYGYDAAGNMRHDATHGLDYTYDFPGNSVFYYFSDHLKTASVISDSAGNSRQHYAGGLSNCARHGGLRHG